MTVSDLSPPSIWHGRVWEEPYVSNDADEILLLSGSSWFYAIGDSDPFISHGCRSFALHPVLEVVMQVHVGIREESKAGEVKHFGFLWSYPVGAVVSLIILHCLTMVMRYCLWLVVVLPALLCIIPMFVMNVVVLMGHPWFISCHVNTLKVGEVFVG